MKVIGIAGPSGSGKSTLARHLATEPGVAYLDADALAWATYAPGGPAYFPLVARFGEDILAEDGTVDRARLARAAFATPQAKADLEAIVHPRVMDEVRRAIERHRDAGTRILLVEGALLLSSPHVDRSLFDAVLWLEVPAEERRARLLDSGLDREAVARRLRGQRDLVPPRDPRVHVVDGRGEPEEVAARVAELLRAGGGP
jgi:dephospho-CoA kinase